MIIVNIIYLSKHTPSKALVEQWVHPFRVAQLLPPPTTQPNPTQPNPTQPNPTFLMAGMDGVVQRGLNLTEAEDIPSLKRGSAVSVTEAQLIVLGSAGFPGRIPGRSLSVISTKKHLLFETLSAARWAFGRCVSPWLSLGYYT